MNRKKIFAVSAGVGAYRYLPTLNCPVNDARDFANVLHRGCAPSEIKLLTDTDATQHSILAELTWLATNAGPNDTAIVFFSGHGGRQSSGDSQAVLCSIETDPVNLQGTGLTSDKLSAALRAIKSERLVVFLDTCYSGGIGEFQARGLNIQTGLNDPDVSALVEGNGRMIFAASRPDEPAWESNKTRNGLFTTYLLEALSGEAAQSDGSVWASDVFSFVSHKLRQRHSQRCYQKSVGEDFVIMVHDRRERLVQPVTLHVGSPLDQRTLRLAMRTAYDREELSRLCHDFGLSIDDLPGRTLENQLMDLIDYCHRHGISNRLIEHVATDRPHLFIRQKGERHHA